MRFVKSGTSDRSRYTPLLILSFCEALFKTSTVVAVMLGGILGAALTGRLALATLPVAAIYVGTTVTTLPASFLMRRLGRGSALILAAGIGTVGAGLSAYAVHVEMFWLFCLGNLLIGIYHGFARYYRFAAVEIVDSAFRSRAISLVVGGGVLAAFIGPWLALWGKNAFGPASYYGAYIALALLGVLSALLVYWIRASLPGPLKQVERGRPLKAIARQPAFAGAIVSGVAAYSVMSATMVAMPLAMESAGHGLKDAATVMQWHMVGMFAPSFVTGVLIFRFGLPAIMLTGVALMMGGLGFVVSGTTLIDFVGALAMMGTGWSFLYVGATTLLTHSHHASEKAKVQGVNELCVFGSSALAAFGVGPLLQHLGWSGLAYVALPLLMAAGSALLWITLRQRE